MSASLYHIVSPRSIRIGRDPLLRIALAGSGSGCYNSASAPSPRPWGSATGFSVGLPQAPSPPDRCRRSSGRPLLESPPARPLLALRLDPARDHPARGGRFRGRADHRVGGSPLFSTGHDHDRHPIPSSRARRRRGSGLLPQGRPCLSLSGLPRAPRSGRLPHAGESRDRLEMEGGRLWVRQGENRFDGSLVGEIGIERSRISVSSFALNRAADPFHATGTLELDLAGPFPRLHLTTDAALARPRAPRPVLGDLFGKFRLDARGTSGPEGFRMEGTARAPRLSYRGVEAHGLAASIAYRSGSLEVSGAEAAVLGGTLKGDATLRWSQAAASSSLLEARVSLSGGSAADVLRWIALPGLSLSGRLDHAGGHRVRNFDPASLEGRGSLKFSGVATFGGKQPATGAARFTLRGSSLAVEEARLQIPTGSVRFEGDVPLASPAEARGDLEASTTHLEDLSPFISKLPESFRRPLSEMITGSPEAELKLTGRLTGGSGGPNLEGRAEGHRLALRGRRPG